VRVFVKDAEKRHLAKKAFENFQAKHGKGFIHLMAKDSIPVVEVRSFYLTFFRQSNRMATELS
jgi:hypothetical protein